VIWLLIIIAIAVLIFYKKPVSETSVLGIDSPILPGVEINPQEPTSFTMPESFNNQPSNPSNLKYYAQEVAINETPLSFSTPIIKPVTGGSVPEKYISPNELSNNL
jgi:hypothetical protein